MLVRQVFVAPPRAEYSADSQQKILSAIACVALVEGFVDLLTKSYTVNFGIALGQIAAAAADLALYGSSANSKSQSQSKAVRPGF